MSQLIFLIPIALFLGLIGLAAFLWSLRSGQFEDMDGAANRLLFDEDEIDDAAPRHSKTPTPQANRDQG